MRSTGERHQRRRRQAVGLTRRGFERSAARLGATAAAGLSLAFGFSLGATAVDDATRDGGAAVAAASLPTYGGAPRGAPSRVTSAADPAAGSAAGASFALASGVRAELVALWDASIVANQERVACIGGSRGRDGVVRITRVYALPVVSADSANAGAGPSLATCRPPEWFGTVHTHIITDPLGDPYTQFSSPDRDVIARWQRAWRSDGVFCLLYSEADAHCEIGGGRSAANVSYAVNGSDGGTLSATVATYSSGDAPQR